MDSKEEKKASMNICFFFYADQKELQLGLHKLIVHSLVIERDSL